MEKLSNCPFCGGEAEIYEGATFPVKQKSRLKSEKEALAFVEECRKTQEVVDSSVFSKPSWGRVNKTNSIHWGARLIARAYIPRCCDLHCIGRSRAMFYSRQEAADAWNKRSLLKEE